MQVANCKLQIDKRPNAVVDSRDKRREFAVAALALFLVALTIRVAAVFAVGSYKLERVTYEHGEIARNLVEGRGFTVRWMGAEGPTSQQAPVYPVLVAASYWLFGIETPGALLALELFQAALGGLLAVVVVLLARELLPHRAGAAWIAGIGTAAYPTLVYAATQVQVASLATLLVVIVFWTAARAARTISIGWATMCGVTSALLVLTDPILGLLCAVAFSVMAIDQARAGHDARYGPLRLAAAAIAACAALTAPWIVRNYLVHGELVFVKSTFGYAFWQGNHPRSLGTDKLPAPASATTKSESPSSRTVLRADWRELERSLWSARHRDVRYIDDVVLSRERVAELGRLSEPERSRRLMHEAVAYLADHPGHYLALCVQRLRFFLLFDETNPKSRVLAYRYSRLALLAFAVAGLWLSRRDARRLRPTYAAFGLVTAFHSLTIVSARFHIPLEPLELVWAACGVATMAAAVRTRLLVGFTAARLRIDARIAAAHNPAA